MITASDFLKWLNVFNVNFGPDVIPIPVPIAYGGTGVTSVTTTPTATMWAGWDANENFSANNFIAGFNTTTTSASTTVLTVSSAFYQYFIGSTTQTVQMPDVTTLILGQSYTFINYSTGVITLQSSGGNIIQKLSPGTNLQLTCIQITGTTESSWNINNQAVNTIQYVDPNSGNYVSLSAPSLSGNVNFYLPSAPANGTLVCEIGGHPLPPAALSVVSQANGTLLIGRNGLPPAANQLTAGIGVGIESLSGQIIISALTGLQWIANSTVGTVTFTANQGIIANNSSTFTSALPTTSNIGDSYGITCGNSSEFIINIGSGQSLLIGDVIYTGPTTITSNTANDLLMIVCNKADTVFIGYASNSAAFIDAGFNATNYTPIDRTVKGNLIGINNALALSSTTSVYVANSGSDSNTGKFNSPFQTIAHAYSSITTASGTNPFNIILLDNYYNESSQIKIKPNISLFTYNGQCTINNSMDIILDSTTWGALSGIGYVYLFNASFNGNVYLDFSGANSSAVPFVQLKNTTFYAGASLNGNASGAVAAYIYEAYYTYQPVFTNVYILSYDSVYSGGIQIGNTTLQITSTSFYSFDDSFYGNVLVQTNPAETTNLLAQFVGATSFATNTADGNKAQINYDVTSWYPTTLTNGAPNPILGSLSNGLKANYNPSNYTPADPSVYGHLVGIDNALGGGGLGVATKSIYVSNNGNDTSGDGRILSPYQTIAHAFTQITTATPTNPFVIVLLDGYYNETVQILIKPNVSILGYYPGTIINNTGGDIILDSTTWSALSGGTSNFIENVAITQNVTFDYNISSSSNGIFLGLNQNTFSGLFTVNGNANSSSQIYQGANLFAGNVLLTNINCKSYNNFFSSFFQFGEIFGQTVNASLSTFSDNYTSSFTLITANSATYSSTATIRGSVLGGTTQAIGNMAQFNVDVVSNTSIALINGAPTPNLISNSDGLSVNYTATNFTPTSSNLTGNIHGIDNKFGTLQHGLAGFFSGFIPYNISGTTYGIGAGSAIDDTNSYFITLSSNVVQNLSTNGVNGLDTGSLTDGWYYTYAIGDSTGVNPPGGLTSLSNTIPTLPGGYNIKILTGVLYVSSGSIISMQVRGTGIEKSYLFDNANGFHLLTTGNATSQTVVPGFAGVVPSNTVDLKLQAVFVANFPSDAAIIDPYGFNSFLNGGSVELRSASFVNNTLVTQPGTLVSPFSIEPGIADQLTYSVSNSSDTLDLYMSGFTFSAGRGIFYPTQVPGMTFWIDANDPNGTGFQNANSSSMGTFVDKSPQQTNLTQGTGANQPIYMTNQLNGLPVVSFTGVNFGTESIMTTANANPFKSFGNGTVSVFIVASANAAGSSIMVSNTYSSSNQFYFNPNAAVGGNPLLWQFGNSSSGGSLSGTGATFNTYYVWNLIVNTSSPLMQVFQNGSLLASQNTASSFNPTGLFLFFGAAQNFNIAEVIFYNLIPTTNQQAMVTKYLRDKWGI